MSTDYSFDVVSKCDLDSFPNCAARSTSIPYSKQGDMRNNRFIKGLMVFIVLSTNSTVMLKSIVGVHVATTGCRTKLNLSSLSRTIGLLYMIFDTTDAV